MGPPGARGPPPARGAPAALPAGALPQLPLRDRPAVGPPRARNSRAPGSADAAAAARAGLLRGLLPRDLQLLAPRRALVQHVPPPRKLWGETPDPLPSPGARVSSPPVPSAPTPTADGIAPSSAMVFAVLPSAAAVSAAGTFTAAAAVATAAGAATATAGTFTAAAAGAGNAVVAAAVLLLHKHGAAPGDRRWCGPCAADSLRGI